MNDHNSKKNGGVVARLKRFLTRDIWEIDGITGFKSYLISVIRVALTTVNGIISKRVLVHASSLSYATLLAVGPLLAITIMFSGMFFKDKGEEFLYDKIMSAATFAMPAFNEMIPEESVDGKSSINPKIFEFINNISKGSSKAGAVGVATMLLTCLLLCINMESAFNFIWGVKKGRKWSDRIVFYFALIFFGSVGLMFGMTFLATSQLSVFVEGIPLISGYASNITYWMGMGVMVAVLASFYKFIPCARVKWRSAFIGALIIVFLLMLNNKMSFIYISYIVKQQDFYGYFAIVAVAMFSLYIFWMMILAGGQISYAVQYVDSLSDDKGWEKMGLRARELCALSVFGAVSKAFYSPSTSATTESISAGLKISKSVVSACLDWLNSKGLVCSTEDGIEEGQGPCFIPAVSPDTVKLSKFFDIISHNEEDETVEDILAREDPLVASAINSFGDYSKLESASKSVRDLLK